VRDAIAWITLNRADAMNAISDTLRGVNVFSDVENVITAAALSWRY